MKKRFQMFSSKLRKLSMKTLGKLETGRIEGMGWAWVEACTMLDHGLDPRNVEMPAVLAKMVVAFETKNGSEGEPS